MTVCPTCSHQTPPGVFCVRCGAPLQPPHKTRSRDRTEFAAAPHQHRAFPWLVSTLFPHLPRESMRDFRVALAIGITAVAALSALHLFGIALVSAAALMPLIALIYFYDADIYESEPLPAIVWTLVWGAASGVALGLLADAVAPHGRELIDKGSTAHLVAGSVLLPALGVALATAGPLALLHVRRFDETLDGVTFGSLSAAALSAGLVIVVGVDVLGEGLRPLGSAGTWIPRTLTIAVAIPVLSMAAVGQATGAVWLRRRAPVRDRPSLGAVGNPAVAFGVAAVLVVSGALGEALVGAWLWLAIVVALDIVAIGLLRRAIHIGLLEESAEKEIGPVIVCANCSESTASHTFCGNCGIALHALPKSREGVRGSDTGRLGANERTRPRRLLTYCVGASAIAGATVLLATAAAPAPPQARCAPHRECGGPPAELLPRVRTAVSGRYQAWESSSFHFSLRYLSIVDPKTGKVAVGWARSRETQGEVELQLAGDADTEVSVGGVASSSATGNPFSLTPADVLDRVQAQLKGRFGEMTLDTNNEDTLVNYPNVGLRSGAGRIYSAREGTWPMLRGHYTVAILAAGDQAVSVAVTVIVPRSMREKAGREYIEAVFSEADDVLDSVRWGTP